MTTGIPYAPSATAAFLRGIERRAAVLAQLYSGDPDAGDHALALAMAAFSADAGRAGFSQWPRVFWSALMAQPVLRAGVAPAWDTPFAELRALDAGARAALLLRLAAGLLEAEAAAVLGISMEEYRRALARACPRDATGDIDVVAWNRLGRGAQEAVRRLPAERLRRIAWLREAALAGRIGLLSAGAPVRPPAAQMSDPEPASPPPPTAQPSLTSASPVR